MQAHNYRHNCNDRPPTYYSVDPGPTQDERDSDSDGEPADEYVIRATMITKLFNLVARILRCPACRHEFHASQGRITGLTPPPPESPPNLPTHRQTATSHVGPATLPSPPGGMPGVNTSSELGSLSTAGSHNRRQGVYRSRRRRPAGARSPTSPPHRGVPNSEPGVSLGGASLPPLQITFCLNHLPPGPSHSGAQASPAIVLQSQPTGRTIQGSIGQGWQVDPLAPSRSGGDDNHSALQLFDEHPPDSHPAKGRWFRAARRMKSLVLGNG